MGAEMDGAMGFADSLMESMGVGAIVDGTRWEPEEIIEALCCISSLAYVSIDDKSHPSDAFCDRSLARLESVGVKFRDVGGRRGEAGSNDERVYGASNPTRRLRLGRWPTKGETMTTPKRLTGEELRALRLRLGLTIREMADELGVDLSTVGRAELRPTGLSGLGARRRAAELFASEF